MKTIPFQPAALFPSASSEKTRGGQGKSFDATLKGAMSGQEESKTRGTDGEHSAADTASAGAEKNYENGGAIDGACDDNQAKSNEARRSSGAFKDIAGRVKLHKGAQENKDQEKRITGSLGKAHGSSPGGNKDPLPSAHAAFLDVNGMLNTQLPLPAATPGSTPNFAPGQVPLSGSEASPNVGGDAGSFAGSAVSPGSQGAGQESAIGMALQSGALFASGPSIGTSQQPDNDLPGNETGDEKTFLEAANLNPRNATRTAGTAGYAQAPSNPALQNTAAGNQAQQDQAQQGIFSHVQSDGLGAGQLPLPAEQTSQAPAAKRNEKYGINSFSAAPAASQVEDTKQQPVTGPANPPSVQPAAVEAARAIAVTLANARDAGASPGMKTKAAPAIIGAEPHSLRPHVTAESVGIVLGNDSGMQNSAASDPGATPASSAAADNQTGTLMAILAFGPATGNLTVQNNGPVTGYEAASNSKGDRGEKGGDPSSTMPGASSNNPIAAAENPPSPAGLSNVLPNPPVIANAPTTAGVLVPAHASGAKRPTSSGTFMQNAAADSGSMDQIKTGEVHLARIWERDGHTEMRIGMKTDDFGKVEVRTQVRDSQVGLAVESERGDLKTYLSPELPGLQTTLHQHSLHLESMDFSHQGGPSAGSQGESYRGNSAGGFDGERQSHAPPGNWPMQPSRSAAAEVAEALSLETSWPRTAGINIHA